MKKFVSVLIIFLILPIFIFLGIQAKKVIIFNLDSRKLTQYENYLKKLPLDSDNSIAQAKNEYIRFFFNTNDQIIRDKAFESFRKFYFQIIDKHNDLLDSANLDLGTVVSKKFEYKSRYYVTKGLAFYETEGDYYFAENFSFIKKELARFLSPMWHEYLNFRTLEQKQGFIEDGYIYIPWDTIRQRIIFLEGFRNKYPEFPEKDLIESKLQTYIYFYLTGDTEFLSYDNNRERVLESYKQFISLNKDSKYYQKVVRYYNLLNSANFKYDNYIEQIHKEIKEPAKFECDYGYFGPEFLHKKWR